MLACKSLKEVIQKFTSLEISIKALLINCKVFMDCSGISRETKLSCVL